MDKELKMEKGIWCARHHEKSAKQCHLNLYDRFSYLCGNDFLESLNKPVILDEYHDEVLCLCGMEIRNSFLVKHPNGVMCRLGANCATRVSHDIIKRYKKSQKTAGTCWLCGTKHKNIPTHYRSENHVSKLVISRIQFEAVLKDLIYKKVKKYDLEKRMEEEKAKLEKYQEEMKEKSRKTTVLNAVVRRKMRECDDIKKGHKKCQESTCRNYITKDEPEWKIRCLSCYKLMKNKIRRDASN